MPNQKTLVVLEPPIRNLIKEIAHANKVSISGLCRDLIKEALEVYEDRYWYQVTSERVKNFKWSKGLTHKQIWNKK